MTVTHLSCSFSLYLFSFFSYHKELVNVLESSKKEERERERERERELEKKRELTGMFLNVREKKKIKEGVGGGGYR